MAFAPDFQGAKDRPEGAAFSRQRIFGAGGMRRIEMAFDDPFVLEALEARGQGIGADAFQVFLEIPEPTPSEKEKIPKDQKGPALAYDIERAGHGAVLTVILYH